MPLSITSVDQNLNGAGCSHIRVNVNHEGVARTFVTSFDQVDRYFDEFSPAERLQMLVTLWAWYRRAQSRSVVGVTIA